MTFAPKQLVRGRVCGRFQVVKSHVSKTGTEVVTVREIGPQGQLASSVMRFPASILVAEK
jgi:hypothetical protein